jgi:hypothetical protein
VNIISLAKYALGVTAAAGMLAGCARDASPSGLGSSLNPALPTSQQVRGSLNTLVTKPGIARAVHPDHSKSWMTPDKKKKKSLLYISDSGANDVYVYSYPGGTLVGTLTGFDEPQGECTQGKNVWISNTATSQLFEYKAGGTSPIATITDSGQYPVGCAYDEKSGDLAVSNIINASFGNGSVSVYPSPTSTPTTYPVTTMVRVYFLGYDKGGNLFVSGSDEHGAYQLAELKHGTSSFTALSVSGATINVPGTVQFADGALAIGDQSGASGYSVLYQTEVSGSTASVTGTTDLTEASDAVQCFILKKAVAVPNAGGEDTQLYKYPAGGTPTLTISGQSEPIGSAIVK